MSYDPKRDLYPGDRTETVRLLRATNIQRSLIELDELQFVDESRVSEQQMLRPGDLVICMANGSKALVGKVGRYQERDARRYTFGAFMSAFRPDPAVVDPYFIFTVFQSYEFRCWIDLILAGSSINNLRPTDIEAFELPLPSRDEQEAIATALSDADDLIASLERLLAKKRDIKQAVMQQLLGGRTRLPGFEGEWHERPLGALITSIESGVSVNSEPGDHLGGPAILKTSAVSQGSFVPNESKAIASRDLGRQKVPVQKDSILVSRMNTIGLVGDSAYVSTDYPRLFVPDRLWSVRTKRDVSAQWLALMLGTRSYRNQLRTIATGTSGSMKNISQPSFCSLTVSVPPLAEQMRIAEVLSGMHAEIEALEVRLAKTRDIKTGMMQELMTGRTRLPIPEDDQETSESDAPCPTREAQVEHSGGSPTNSVGDREPEPSRPADEAPGAVA